MLLLPISKKILIPVITVFLLFIAIGGIYLFRSPVLIVTDSLYETLIGPKRIKRLESGISRALFRRVIPVEVDSGAGPDLIALAVEDAHKSPWAVLFPGRYLDGARNFTSARPDVPVLVMAGGNQNIKAEDGFAIINTDTALDLYRAGLCAALFAGGNNVFFISDGTLTDELKDKFIDGLRAQGHLDEPMWTRAGFDYSSRDDLGCVVVAAPAAAFLERNLPAPVILFSWTNPSYTPKAVKVVFNDSPLVFAAKALKHLPKGGEEVFIESSVVIIKDRIAEKRDFRKIKGFIRENFQENFQNE
jgi:hypothetical protein